MENFHIFVEDILQDKNEYSILLNAYTIKLIKTEKNMDNILLGRMNWLIENYCDNYTNTIINKGSLYNFYCNNIYDNFKLKTFDVIYKKEDEDIDIYHRSIRNKHLTRKDMLEINSDCDEGYEVDNEDDEISDFESYYSDNDLYYDENEEFDNMSDEYYEEEL